MGSARNAFLNNRLITFNNMFSNSNITKNDKHNLYDHFNDDDDDQEHDQNDDDDDDDDAAKCMKMISHKRKNSDSTMFNKSPSFLSTLKDETQIDKDEFYLDANDNDNNIKDNEEKMIQPSKSRNEIVYRHKKKPKKKRKKKNKKK